MLCYWTGGGLVLHNYATGARLPATPYHCAVLDAAGAPCTAEALRAACPELDHRAVRSIVRQLQAQGMLHDARRPLPPPERLMQGLAAWNPEAGFFHTATKNVNFGGVPDETRSGSRRHAPRVKELSGLPVIPLPLTPLGGEFPSVLLARRTARRFARPPVTLDELAMLLRLTAGVHWTFRAGKQAVSLRTSPSGGASHPIEVYVAARNVKGLRRGLYHYASDRHRLHRLENRLRAIDQYLPGQRWYRDAAALVFFAATFERTRLRYPYSRAYRAVLVEAGHLAQTFCLAATWLRLAPFCSLAIADDVADRDLGLDGISESVLYAAGVGVPFAAPVNMAPDGTRQPKLLPNPYLEERGPNGPR